MVLASITPRISYSQGNKWDLNLKTLEDLHKPEFDQIGLVYKSEIREQLPDNNKYMSIDLGVNNLASIVTNTSNKAVLMDGKRLKSINQYYNKKKAKIQSQLKKINGKENSRRLMNLTRKRNNKVGIIVTGKQIGRAHV